MSSPIKPLKVLIVSRWLWEENRRSGGNGTTQELCEALLALGHEVVVLSQSPKVRKLVRADIGPLETWLTPREKRRSWLTGLWDKFAKQRYNHRKVYSDALDLRDFLKKRGPFDVLYAQSEEPDGLVAAVAQDMGVPLPPIFTQIQALRYRFKGNEQEFTDQLGLGLTFKNATMVLANSEMIARDIAKHYSAKTGEKALREKTQVLHHNLTTTFIQSAENVGLEPEKDRVLFLGALNEKKGPLVFLEALPYAAAKTSSSITFAMIGGFTEDNAEFAAWWELALKTAQAKLGALSPNLRLELLGKLKADQVLREIQRATVVVMPSLYDEFSRAVAEALATGRPVITTDQVGAAQLISTKEIPVDDAWESDPTAPGFVIRRHDARMLAWAISSALDPQAPQMENAQRLAPGFRKQLSPDAIARKLTGYFHTVLTGPTR